jgi:putative chitinase
MLSSAALRDLFPRAPEAHVVAFADQAPALFRDFGLAGHVNRLEFFLAQIGHESGGLTISVEKMNYSAERLCQVWPTRFPTLEAARPFAGNPERLANTVYGGRMGNGPFESGDGWRFRGRGYIQITGREGYEAVGAIAGLDLVAEPERAAAPESALRVACAFWQWKKLNPLCDEGDFERVTKRINGGTIGQADRRAWLDRVRRVFADPPPITVQPPAEQVLAVQQALRARGYKELGVADGLIGPRTLAAIRRYRQEHDLPAEGGFDSALLVALDLG